MAVKNKHQISSGIKNFKSKSCKLNIEYKQKLKLKTILSSFIEVQKTCKH